VSTAVSAVVAVRVVVVAEISAPSATIPKDRHAFDHVFAHWIEGLRRQREQISGSEIKSDKHAREAGPKKDQDDHFHGRIYIAWCGEAKASRVAGTPIFFARGVAEATASNLLAVMCEP
jgi:hypothetical protein